MKVHCFDVGGTVVNMDMVGERHLAAYQKWAGKKNIDKQIIKRTIENYQARLREEPWAIGSRKKEIVKALEDPLFENKVPINYDNIFQEDTLQVFREVIKAKQGIILFATGDIPWVKDNLPKDIAKKILHLYSDDKTDPKNFLKVIHKEKREGHQIISHTADTMPELRAAKETGRIPHLFFINRNNTEIREEVEKIAVFLSSMKEANYTHLRGS